MVAKKPGTPGRSRISRKPSRRECRSVSVVPVVCSCAFLRSLLHTRRAGATAPGIPCALLIKEGQRRCKARADSCRDNADVWPLRRWTRERGEGKQASRLHARPCTDAAKPCRDVAVVRIKRLTDLVAEIEPAIEQDVGEGEALAAD